MISQDLIEQTKTFVKAKLSGEGTGHDWFHSERVYKTAVRIAAEEGADSAVVELAALLHDIADWKFTGSEDSGPLEARKWLSNLGADKNLIDKVCVIIDGVTFKGAGAQEKPLSLEGQIVRDADRLDALGAIGIARAFAYGGSKGREIYNPSIKPEMHASFEVYKKSVGTTVNHFYEKLFLLKDRIHTQAALKIAEERHQYMQEFIDRFKKEWNGED